MQQHSSKYFARRSLPNYPTPALGIESLGQSSFFSEHGHVTYQVKDRITNAATW